MMIAYLDSSVLLRILLNQPGKLEEFFELEYIVSSRILKTECQRTLDRARIAGHLLEAEYIQVMDELYNVLEHIEFVELTIKVLERAGANLPISLGTLDAIHLVSAQLWQEMTGKNLLFLTHDEKLEKAARIVGLHLFRP